MALSLTDLKAQLVIEASDDDAFLTRLLAAAKAYIEGEVGYALDDAPADLEQAVLLTAAHWFENRESVVTGTIATSMPFGVAQIVANRRNYTFAATDE